MHLLHFLPFFTQFYSYIPHILLQITSFLLPIWSFFVYEASVLSLGKSDQPTRPLFCYSDLLKSPILNSVNTVFVLPMQCNVGTIQKVYMLQLSNVQWHWPPCIKTLVTLCPNTRPPAWPASSVHDLVLIFIIFLGTLSVWSVLADTAPDSWLLTPWARGLGGRGLGVRPRILAPVPGGRVTVSYPPSSVSRPVPVSPPPQHLLTQHRSAYTQTLDIC